MASSTDLLTSERNWMIARRWQAYAAEGRANLLRIIAVGAFYLVHLWSYLSAQGKLPQIGFLQLAEPGAVGQQFHVVITLLSVAWATLALGILLALQQRMFPPWLPYFSTAVDIVLLTSMICLGAVARSPLVVGYFLILVLAALRLSLPLIRFATAGCAAAYLAVLGCAKWPEAMGISSLHGDSFDVRVQRYHQLIILLAIALAGVTLGQVIRQVRQIVEEYNSRRPQQ